MLKRFEDSDPASCFNRALAGEHVFVLLARDPAAPSAIRHWAHVRVHLRLNQWGDDQIQDALAEADRMEVQRDGVRSTLDLIRKAPRSGPGGES